MPHNTTLEHEIDEIDDSRYIGFGVDSNTTKGNAFLGIAGSGTMSTATPATFNLNNSVPPVSSGTAVTWSVVPATMATITTQTDNRTVEVASTTPGKFTLIASGVDGYKSGTFDVTVAAG